MSLVGTRPILPDELEQYELHHRARIAIKPGITGMWQVSGRSDITDFEEIVRLDTEYISDYRYNAGKEYIVIEEDAHSEKIPINFASSGQQEVLWLLNQLYILMLKKEKAFVIIEEPEAHLYPGLQSKVVEFISYFANVNDSAIFITTHTGQRRLARNLLRDVVGRYVGNEPDSLYALNEIQKVAALMRFELERGKIDEFADLLNYHWELSRKVDAGSTNTLIDQIFLSIEDLIDAKMVCGAGGGGFLQVILKKGVQKADVHKRLKDVFQDNPVDVWDCEII